MVVGTVYESADVKVAWWVILTVALTVEKLDTLMAFLKAAYWADW